MSATPPASPPAAVANPARRIRDLLLTPKAEWERIAAEPTTVARLFTRWVVPLAAIPPVAWAVGELLFQKTTRTPYGVWTERAPLQRVLAGAGVWWLLALLQIVALAAVVEALAPTFGAKRDRIAAYKLAAYSLTPAWLAGVCYILPVTAPAGQLLGLYAGFLLFVGVPRVVGAAPERRLTFVLLTIAAFIVTALVATVLTGLVGGFGGLRLA